MGEDSKEQWLWEIYGLTESDLADYAEKIAAKDAGVAELEDHGLEDDPEINWTPPVNRRVGRVVPEAEIAAKDARIAVLEEALKPFSEISDKYAEMFASIPDDQAARHELEVWATLADLRRARDVLNNGCQATTEPPAAQSSAAAQLPTYQTGDEGDGK